MSEETKSWLVVLFIIGIIAIGCVTKQCNQSRLLNEYSDSTSYGSDCDSSYYDTSYESDRDTSYYDTSSSSNSYSSSDSYNSTSNSSNKEEVKELGTIEVMAAVYHPKDVQQLEWKSNKSVPITIILYSDGTAKSTSGVYVRLCPWDDFEYEIRYTDAIYAFNCQFNLSCPY